MSNDVLYVSFMSIPIKLSMIKPKTSESKTIFVADENMFFI